MGWTFIHQNVSNTKDFLTKQFSYESPSGDYAKVIDCKTRINVAYLAVEQGNINTEASVIGVVVLIKRERGSFGYKAIPESHGPYYYGCPESILNLLSETKDEYAIAWRKACRETEATKKMCKQIEVGDTLVFTDTFRFGKTGSDNTFRCSDKKRGIYWAVNLGILVKLTTSNIINNNFMIVKAPK